MQQRARAKTTRVMVLLVRATLRTRTLVGVISKPLPPETGTTGAPYVSQYRRLMASAHVLFSYTRVTTLFSAEKMVVFNLAARM
jgi:hypothetical protein